MKYVLAAAALGLFGQGALAFQETTIGGEGKDAKAQAAPVLELSTPSSTEAGKGVNMNGPGLHIQTPGTEVKIPGIGTVGVLPKLDLGLELLHGAGEAKGPGQDKTAPDDVQLRGTIKYRF